MADLDVDAIWSAVDEQRLGLADLLTELSEEDWAHPSLCARWTVRDVVAHLALAQTGRARATIDIVRAGGSFDRMIRDTARRHARASTAQLIAEIRNMAGSRRLAPMVSDIEPLLDILVHGQDIAVPLGRAWPVPVDAAALAATRVWTMRWPLSRAFPIRRRLRAARLVASDTDWSVGTGPRVEGPIRALLLLLTGRVTTAVPDLSGPGLHSLEGIRSPQRD